MKNGDYELIDAPADYPGKRYRGRYCYEHHYVWWKNTGELVLLPEMIHHKDEDKRHNEFSNLEKMTRSKHMIHHAGGEAQHGSLTKYRKGCRCDSCKKARADYMKVWRKTKGH